MKSFWIKKGLKIAAFVILAILVFGFVVMNLWNWLMPVLFGLPLITFAQALGILLLSKILFSGFRPGGGRGERWKAGMKKRWERKLAQLSPEEREKLKQTYQDRCGGWFGNKDANDCI